jgi:hypothetical protein
MTHFLLAKEAESNRAIFCALVRPTMRRVPCPRFCVGMVGVFPFRVSRTPAEICVSIVII